MKIISWIFLFSFFFLASCSDEFGGRIDLSKQPWSVTGFLVSGDGKPLADQRIEIIRVQRSGIGVGGSEYEARIFAMVKTDQSGKFFFATPVSGVYEVSAKAEYPCLAHASLGSMGSENRSIKLVMDPKKCILVL